MKKISIYLVLGLVATCCSSNRGSEKSVSDKQGPSTDEDLGADVGSSQNKSKTFSIESWGNGAPELEITLPGNMEYKKMDGPDFDVHYFTRLTSKEVITIYVGHHPDFKKPSEAKISSQYVGTIKTDYYIETRSEMVSSESIVKDFFKGHTGAGVEDLLLHIMILGQDLEFHEKVFGYLKTLRIKNSSN